MERALFRLFAGRSQQGHGRCRRDAKSVLSDLRRCRFIGRISPHYLGPRPDSPIIWLFLLGVERLSILLHLYRVTQLGR